MDSLPDDAGGQRRIKARGDSDDGIMDNASFSFYEGNDLICQLDRGDEIQDDKAYQPKFLLLDHLGTTRAELKFVKDEDTGEITPTIATGYDYMPYGELITEEHLVEAIPGNPDPRTEQVLFTGKPRDKESGLDDFGPRKYSSMLARWMSPDIIFIDNDIFNPQSWNLYSYVRGNPVVFLDPNGQYAFDSNATEDDKKKFKKGLEEANNAMSKYDKDSKEYKKIKRSLDKYGTEGDGNGIVVRFDQGMSDPAKIDKNNWSFDDSGNLSSCDVYFRPADGVTAENIAHEGTHLSNGEVLIKSALSGEEGPIPSSNYDYWDEVSAYHTSFLVSKGRIGRRLEAFYVKDGSDKYKLWTQRSSFFKNLKTLNKFLKAHYKFNNVASPADMKKFINAGN